jgi:hypothetical protein
MTTCTSSARTASLRSVVQSIDGFSKSVTSWRSTLGSSVGSGHLERLDAFSEQAGGLAESLRDSAGGVGASVHLDGLRGLLGKLAAPPFKLDSLRRLPAAELTERVAEFGDSAKRLGEAADAFLGDVGKAR